MIYKICEYENGLGEKKFTIRYLYAWYLPFWQPLTQSMSRIFPYEGTRYFDTYKEAEKVVKSLKEQDEKDRLSKFKLKKCEIIK